MDIREMGTPITASQRRSYREAPDSSFYATFQAAFAAQKAVSYTHLDVYKRQVSASTSALWGLPFTVSWIIFNLRRGMRTCPV